MTQRITLFLSFLITTNAGAMDFGAGPARALSPSDQLRSTAAELEYQAAQLRYGADLLEGAAAHPSYYTVDTDMEDPVPVDLLAGLSVKSSTGWNVGDLNPAVAELSLDNSDDSMDVEPGKAAPQHRRPTWMQTFSPVRQTSPSPATLKTTTTGPNAGKRGSVASSSPRPGSRASFSSGRSSTTPTF